MATRNLLPADLLRQLLDYDPLTGAFIWKDRPEEGFSSPRVYKAWRTRCLGKRADGHARAKMLNTYAEIKIEGETFLAHRIGWCIHYGNWPIQTIDHVNGTKWDNRIANLRDVSHRENQRNRQRGRNNTSGVIGVRQPTRSNKWLACINVRGEEVSLGLFDTFDEAVAARKQAEKDHGYHANHGRP